MNLLLTMMVALLVFGPKKLPTIARHLGHFMRRMTHYKETLMVLWQAELNKQQLEENLKKAALVDELIAKEKD